MHILFLHQYYNTPEMPGGPRAHALATRFVRAGHRVTVITTDRTAGMCPGGWRRSWVEGVEVHWAAVPYSHAMGYAERVRAFADFATRAAVRVIDTPADVIFASSTPLTIVIPAIVAKQVHRAPLVLELRDLWPEAAVAMGAIRSRAVLAAASALERIAYQQADAVVALAPRIAQGAIRNGARPGQVFTSTNAADPSTVRSTDEEACEVRRQLGLTDADRMVLYAGTLGRVNHSRWLAELAANVVAGCPRTWFVFVGGGRERHHVDAVSAGSPRVRRLDRVPRKMVGAFLRAASIGVCSCLPDPRLSADATNKVADYLGAGLPIAVNYGGPRTERLCCVGAAIRLPDCPRDAAQRLVATLDDARWISEAQRASRELGRGEFGIDHVAAGVLAVIERAGHGGGDGR